ncbi:MAG: N-acetylmuramoyl-L-alanine amidase [candidate division Zixibacteria bacterium]|nr:N-acetylmuramoyl-L-alanine amidase [candidate division Zixibacteria bacterium]
MKPNYITVHCSATPPSGHNIGVIALRDMHKARGWSDIGYHWVIKRDGTLQPGRPMTRNGAGVKGHNEGNIHVCLVGGIDECGESVNNYTDVQFDALRYCITEWSGRFGIRRENIKGHRDWPKVAKDCPCFDVRAKLKEWSE